MNNFRYFHKFHLGNWVAYAFFFSMLFVPLTYRHVKASLLGLLMIMIIINMLVRGKLSLHQTVFLWTLLIVLSGTTSFLIGVINNTPGALYVAHTYILWPLVFALLVASITNENIINGLIKVLVFSTTAISLYSLFYILNLAGYLPGKFYAGIIDHGQRIGFHEGYVHYISASIYTLIFSVPFLLSALMIWQRDTNMPVSRFWLWVAVGLGLIVTLLSGRRSLWLVVALSPIFTIVFYKLSAVKYYFFKKMCRSSLLAVLLLFVLFSCLHAAFDIDLLSMVQRFTDAFQFNLDAGAIVRREQFFALLQGWMDNPLLGAGLGASVENSIRSAQTWQYELFYILLLFQTGVIGFSIYFVSVMWIYWMGFKMIRSGEYLGLCMTPVLVGTSCFLIASATNPYLGTFCGLWPIFFPIALINVWLLKRKNYCIRISNNNNLSSFPKV